MTDDRLTVDRMADSFSAAEREHHEGLERSMRLQQRRRAPASLRVNVDESQMTSPNGAFSDEELASMERQHRKAVERYKSD